MHQESLFETSSQKLNLSESVKSKLITLMASMIRESAISKKGLNHDKSCNQKPTP